MSKELDVAVKAAKEAGEIIKENFGKSQSIILKENKSFLTETDVASERKIISIIEGSFPNHSIIAEESGLSERSSEYSWFIDPIDGTTNFVMKVPLFVVSIALMKQDKPILGVVYDPILDELYSAEIGQKAQINNETLKVSEKNSISEFMMGYARPNAKKEEFLKIFQKLEFVTRTPKILGSMAIHLCYVAAGKSDAAVILAPNSWDIAAGAFVVEKAGGKVTDFEGKPWSINSKNILASNGRIHQELIDILKE